MSSLDIVKTEKKAGASRNEDTDASKCEMGALSQFLWRISRKR